MNTTQVSETQLQAAVAELKECQRQFNRLIDSDDATSERETPALTARLNNAQSVVDAYWSQAPEGFIARQLLQQPDL